MKIFILALLILILTAGGFFIFSILKETDDSIRDTPNVEQQIAPVVRSTPSPHPNIQINSPSPNELVTSPINITGQARGTWFFEATFPIQLLDSQRNLITESYASTEEDWMTEEFVSFSAELEFELPETQNEKSYANAFLILEKNNPSDKRELDDEIEFEISLTKILAE